MAGLLTPAEKRGTGGPANTSNADTQGAGLDGTSVSPEEQEQYNAFVTNGMQMIDNPEALPKFLESIKGAGSPVEGMANALAMLVMRLEDSAAESGQKISGDVMLHGGTELLEGLVELAEAAGVHEFDEKEMESALYLAMDIYRTSRTESGSLPDKELSRDWQELQRAERGGELEEMLPGIGEYDKGLPKPEPKGKGA